MAASITERMTALLERRDDTRDPFAKLSPEGGEALNTFVLYLSLWMGNTHYQSLGFLKKTWKSSPELRAWLKKYVNTNVGPLYYGKNAKHPPAIGTTVERKHGVLHWSKELGRARKFAQLAGYEGRGYIIESRARPTQIIVDTDALSALAGKHRASFRALVTRQDPFDLFNGEQYEGEVITTPLTGKVIEITEGRA